MAAVSFDERARKDPRFIILGKRLGTSHFDARGRMIEVWAHCTEVRSYYLSAEIIDVLAEFEGFSELICSADVNLAEKTEKGIRIRGTKGRIEWLENLRKNAKKGGFARASQKATQKAAKRLASGSDLPQPESSPITTAITTASSSITNQEEEKNNTKRTRSRTPVVSPFDIQSAYESYPLKKGKTPGIQKLSREVKTQEDYDALLKAIERYKKSSEVQRGFIKHFSTFASEWRDWTTDDAGTSSITPRKSFGVQTVPGLFDRNENIDQEINQIIEGVIHANT